MAHEHRVLCYNIASGISFHNFSFPELYSLAHRSIVRYTIYYIVVSARKIPPNDIQTQTWLGNRDFDRCDVDDSHLGFGGSVWVRSHLYRCSDGRRDRALVVLFASASSRTLISSSIDALAVKSSSVKSSQSKYFISVILGVSDDLNVRRNLVCLT